MNKRMPGNEVVDGDRRASSNAARWELACPRLLAILLLWWLPFCAFGDAGSERRGPQVPILLYHRFEPVAHSLTTITPSAFEWQLKYLKSHGYKPIPLTKLVAYIRHEGPPPAPCSVALVADDDHISIYTRMFPLVRQYQVPVTLFIYPSAISHASYAMTWDQLKKMKASGLVDVQSQTYWHPNFKEEKKQRPPEGYMRFAETQLVRSKEVLGRQLGGAVDMLAWPFGIYDDELIRFARKSGYVAGFTLERRAVRASDSPMTMPRFLITKGLTEDGFARLLPQGCSPMPGHG